MKLPLKINRNSFTEKVKEFLIGMFFFILVLFVTGMFSNICDMLIFKEFSFSFLKTFNEKQTEGLKDISIFFIVLLGPFMEELIFRLPLVLKSKNIQISLCFLCLYFFGDKITSMSFNSYSTWIKLIPISIIICYGKHFILEKHLVLIQKKYFKMYFVSLSILFGIAHLTNFYKVIPSHLLIYSPIFIIPHIVLGFFIGYIRLNKGFFSGLAFHSLYNLIIVLIFLPTQSNLFNK